MRHQVKKVKFRMGTDASKMTMRKLANNFITYGHLVTTKKRAKSLISFVERLIVKAKEQKESDKNYLKSKLANVKTIKMIIEEIAPKFDKRVSGFIRLINLPYRESDSAVMAKVEWTEPIVREEKKAEEVKITEKSKIKEVEKK